MITTKIHKLSLLEFATSCTRPFHCRCILATKMKGVNVAKTPGSMLFIKEHVKGFVKKKAKLCGCIQENCKTYVLGLCIWAFDNKVFSVRFLSLETFGHEQQNISVFLPNSLAIHNGFWKGQSWTILIKLPLFTCWLSSGWSFLCIQSPIMTNIQI